MQKIWGGPTSIARNPELQVAVYPNPAVDFLTVESGENKTMDYRLINLTGQIVRAGKIVNGQNRICLEKLKTGLYFLILTNPESSWSKQYKIIKMAARQ
ncbi:T9SS type A sorting domain-containing protein [Candidatus Sulfidibacterium hydrothermale]|uniref:T9SS type A sorting domain-containing protein n=1 Tax=Candidatus Sulfidibacterium hydrothermale TaxID=2875962 RepID=UPI003744056E|nr:T9SS type A sorting domain-containing protein [Candidatus Sulfidibacterium hydrothermale]